MKKALIIIGAIFAGLTIIGLVSPEPTTAPVAATSEVISEAPIIPADLEVTAPPPTVDRTREAVVAWGERNGPIISEMAELMTTIGEDASNYDVDSMSYHCSKLGRIVSDLRSRPVPDPEINAPLSEALGHYARGANACIRGAQTMDADSLNESGREMSLGTDALKRATTALGKYL